MIHSFLLIGQSNMAGRGFLSEAVEVDTSHIKILRNGRWQGMFRPVNPDRSFSGVCLAERFAELYAQKHGVDVGLIPCADGGTPLDYWQPGSLLFDHAVGQAKLAERSSTIAGVLWHQGEADCRPELCQTYQQRFEAMRQEFRKQLDLYDVPFLIGGLGDFLSERRKDDPVLRYSHLDFNRVLEKIAREDEMTGFVSAEGLGSNPDHLHFSAASLYEFGERYFRQMEALARPDKIFTEKDIEGLKRTEMELL